VSQSESYTANQEILERVLEISKRMAQTRELKPLLEYVIEQAVEFTGGQHGYLVLIDENKELVSEVKYGKPDDEGQKPFSRSIIQQVIQEKQPVLTSDAQQDDRYQHQISVLHLQLRSVLCVPLLSRGQLLGVLYVENREITSAFHSDDIPPLMIFAGQAAVAIENAQLNQKQERWANELEERVRERTAELEAASREAEIGWQSSLEMNRIRTALLGNIVHDLRSPLNTIVNIIELMQIDTFGDVNEEQGQWLARALTSANQIDRLVGDIFDLTKIEQGELRLNPDEIDPVKLLEQVFSVAGGMQIPETVELHLEVVGELPHIYADPGRLQQILMNLISNAVKFTSEGRITIRAEVDVDENSILFSVSDTGIGIAPQEQARVFDRFYRAEEQRRRANEGTGLGLAICKELVEQHGGQIWVSSEPGIGSTFFFTIPLTL
jgi:signal transduction histidine kinase